MLGPFNARYRWLGHYLSGQGGEKVFPARLVDWPAVARSVHAGQVDGEFRMGHYTNKPGSGLLHTLFGGNEMFYVIASMPFTVGPDQYDFVVLIQGMDRYWWHEQSGGFWWTLPIPGPIVSVLRLFAGANADRWFPRDGPPHGNPGISNQLWADMTEVGAKPFYTVMALTKDKASWEELLANNPLTPP